jgi:hypothetical protein
LELLHRSEDYSWGAFVAIVEAASVSELRLKTQAMSRKYVFADECGNFDFSSRPGASRYFILVTVTVDSCSVGQRLLDIRRDLALQGFGLGREFHAAHDPKPMREKVFAVIVTSPIRIDAVILEKSKADPSVRESDERFYKTAWYQHMKYVPPKIAASTDELLVVSASLGSNAKKRSFHAAVTDVIKQVSPTAKARVACWSAASDPCLQVADYCAWAIQRKWEAGDRQGYDLIKGSVETEFELFASGTTKYY